MPLKPVIEVSQPNHTVMWAGLARGFQYGNTGRRDIEICACSVNFSLLHFKHELLPRQYQSKSLVANRAMNEKMTGVVVCMIVLFNTEDYFPYLFTNSIAVAEETTKLAMLLGFTVLLNSLQPVLSGVAVGAGWQSLVAYINTGCYYIVGLPAGILLGFTFGSGVIVTLLCLFSQANLNQKCSHMQAEEAESRVKRWGGLTGGH
ncbi:protein DETOXIFICATION 33-like [Durio zibethinus]|uniref:Protein DETOXIFICATION 33-like n=1 Tax=Durio zibethinus TaxID=66656 RepID=A0A6P5ZDB4_DURZI|nr:protein DETOXIFICATION 33-like [Durio zibethinus]